MIAWRRRLAIALAGAAALVPTSSCVIFNWTPADTYELGAYDQALVGANDRVAQGIEVFDHHLVAMDALGKLARDANAVTRNDSLARGHYEEAQLLVAGDPGRDAALELTLARYYEATYRSRSALPHLQSALVSARQAQHPELEISALHGLARVFADMGEVELKRRHQDQAIETAEAQFPDGVLHPGPVLNTYLEVLDWDLQDALLDPDPRGRIVKSWKRLDEGLEAIFPLKTRLRALPVFGPFTLGMRQMDLAKRTRLALHAAVVFAEIGERQTARAIFDRTAAELVDIGGKAAIRRLRNRMLCTRAKLAYEFESYRRASKLVDQCVESAATAQDRETLTQRSTALLAQIKEATGEFTRADALYRQDVTRFETVRTAIPVQERSVFFRGAGRIPWEGLVRVRGAMYAQAPSQEGLRALLEASDGMRARQLRELKGERKAYTPTIDTIRERLGKDGTLLIYSAVGDDVLGIAMTARGAHVQSLGIEPSTLDARLAAIVGDVERLGPQWGGGRQELEALGETLLGPFSAAVAGKGRLTVVADGALGAFPIELLRVDGRALGDTLAVGSSPSLAFFETTRPREVSDALYALGDPAYTARPEASGDLANFADHSRGSAYLGMFTPLPETRSEVEALAELFDGRTTIALGAQASESYLQAHPPTGHAYVHFATHGLLAGQIPGLAEPALVLSNEEGHDGFLTASEVAELPLDADLTVLSACSTGAGESLPGEGVLGMGRAFLVAGSRGVLVSLWPVDSAATEALMVLFYRYHRAGLDAAQALKLAKEQLRTQPQWDHPYFYAAFVLVAEGGLLQRRGNPVEVAAAVKTIWRSPDASEERRGLTYDGSGPVPGTFDDDYSVQPAFE